jgi:gas vesicle protein
MNREVGGGGGGILGWFVLGAAIGAVAALITAPRTRQQARDLLLERGGDVAKRAQELAEQAQHQAGEWLEKGREVFEEQTQRLVSAFEAGREAMQEELRKRSSSS